jgi:Glyoxalase superfamily protein
MDISFNRVVPILRIFDIGKADEFYQGFLRFKVDWDHRFDPGAPLSSDIARQFDFAFERASRRQ